MIHSEMRRLHAYWTALRAGRLVPYRSEVDPRDMACSARNLFILEEIGASDHRFRLAGTGLVEAFGMELRGMAPRVIMQGAARRSFTALIDETLDEPGIGYARLQRAEAPEEIWEILLLPLRTDAGQIARALGALHPVRRKTQGRVPVPLRFEIEMMTIHPIETAATAGGPAGFADEPAGFAQGPSAQTPNAQAQPAAATAHLTPIDGGRPPGTEPDPRPQPDLKIIRND